MGLFGFPRAVFFILGAELCERFSFYGLRAVLVVYLMEKLDFSEDAAASIFHAFVVLAYAFPVLGGIVADWRWGKFNTVWRLCLVYVVGGFTLALWASRAGMFVGLGLIAAGTGGIKPCVVSFGQDQILDLPADRVARYFSLFYLCINLGSLMSTFLTPLLVLVSFLLAFIVPAILLLVGTVVFVAGVRWYNRVPASGDNSLVLTARIIFMGASRRLSKTHRRSNSEAMSMRFDGAEVSDGLSADASSGDDATILASATPRRGATTSLKPHWLNHPDILARFGAENAAAVRRLLSISLVFLPLPVFWALFDQHSSRWVQQAGLLCREIKIGDWDFDVQPSQMPVFNPLAVVLLIPLFERGIYPVLRRRGWNLDPLRRMVVGMIITSLAFGIAGVMQLIAEAALPSGPEWDDLTWEERTAEVEKICASESGPKPPHVGFQVFQFLVLTTGEILVSISGLEFAGNQAPKSMKAVVQALWTLTTSMGNLLVAVIAGLSVFRPAVEAFFYAALMFTFMLVFWFLARRYEPLSEHEEDGEDSSSSVGSDASLVGLSDSDRASSDGEEGTDSTDS
jgi:dipeptide/tripeptide permease